MPFNRETQLFDLNQVIIEQRTRINFFTKYTSNMDPMIVVNGFAFCRNHGDEYCHYCTYDHRLTNNFRVEDDPAIAQIIEDGVYDMEERTSINVYDKGAIPVGGRSEDYECRKHNKVDCDDCFDWVKFIKEDAKAAQAQDKWIRKREKYFNKRGD